MVCSQGSGPFAGRRRPRGERHSPDGARAEVEPVSSFFVHTGGHRPLVGAPGKDGVLMKRVTKTFASIVGLTCLAALPAFAEDLTIVSTFKAKDRTGTSTQYL